MNLKNYFILCSFCLSFGIGAQTKIIWHKSHSGNMDNFKILLENKNFNLEWSNFGRAPRPQMLN